MRTTLAIIMVWAGTLYVSASWAQPPKPSTDILAASRLRAAKESGKTSLAPANSSESATSDSQSPASPAPQREVAVFAGGCFWCTELVFQQLKGVYDVESGYCGGSRASANYFRVHQGATGHAESIRVTYDPQIIRYDQLLDVFFDAHDPTQYNGQGEGTGRAYRSAIFFANEAQKKQAEDKMAELKRQRVYARHIVTRLEPLKTFYPAEDYHQDFALNHPWQEYIQSEAIPKACNVRIKHPELIRQSQ